LFQNEMMRSQKSLRRVSLVFGCLAFVHSVSLGASTEVIRSHCATAQTMQWVNESLGTGPKAEDARSKLAVSARMSKSQASRPFSRVWITPHFTLYYSLLGIHQSKLLQQDSGLVAALDKAKVQFGSLTGDAKDSAIYSQLDNQGITAPAFVQRAGEVFEMALSYFTDTLGMAYPTGTNQSNHYRGPVSTGKRIVVDLADINHFQSGYDGVEYYGLTLRPPNLAIVLENDFLWNATLQPSGKVVGDSVSSKLNGKLIHNYAREYDLGLRLTIYHEFFHVMQFNYVPNPRGYHAWYELSAVGMEERKVPDGNDYLQYLPCIFNSPEAVGLLSTGNSVCNPEAAYSNSIFHMYLSHVLGITFDAPIWESLSKNGDKIDLSLAEVLQGLGHSLKDLYPDYIARLLLSGQPSHPLHFVSDMPNWPSMKGDSLHPDEMTAAYTNTLAPLSFLPLRIPDTFAGGRVSTLFAGDSSASQVRVNPTGISQSIYPRSSAFLSSHPGDGKPWLLLYNLDFKQSADIQIQSSDVPFRVYPNPLSLFEHESLSLTRSNQIRFPTTFSIINENGKTVHTQVAQSYDDLMDWDLKDSNGKAIQPGIFYWRLNQETWHPVFITP
jgi:hypothetical protein